MPVYLHPTQPPISVRQAYFLGFSDAINFGLATGAWGWHVETGLHALRLIVCRSSSAIRARRSRSCSLGRTASARRWPACRAFLDAAPISAADREKISRGNAERLLGL